MVPLLIYTLGTLVFFCVLALLTVVSQVRTLGYPPLRRQPCLRRSRPRPSSAVEWRILTSPSQEEAHLGHRLPDGVAARVTEVDCPVCEPANIRLPRMRVVNR